VPDVLLHFSGLTPGRLAWWGRWPIGPNSWVRIDPKRHPEVESVINSGIAVIRETAPPHAFVLDEERALQPPPPPSSSAPSKRRRDFRRRPTDPRISRLTIKQLENGARAYVLMHTRREKLAQAYLEKMGIEYVGAQRSRRGRRRSVSIHPFFSLHILIAIRGADLIASRKLEILKKRRARLIRESVASASYGSRDKIRRSFRESLPTLPSRRALMTLMLRKWKLWTGSGNPSRETLRRYRWGDDYRQIDELILKEAVKT
jgi:hypothetical protein